MKSQQTTYLSLYINSRVKTMFPEEIRKPVVNNNEQMINKNEQQEAQPMVPDHLTLQQFKKLSKFNSTAYFFVPPPIQLQATKLLSQDNLKNQIMQIAKSYTLFNQNKVSLDPSAVGTDIGKLYDLNKKNLTKDGMIQEKQGNEQKFFESILKQYEEMPITEVSGELKFLLYRIYGQIINILMNIVSEQPEIKSIHLMQKIRLFFYLCERARAYEAKWLILNKMKQQTEQINAATEEITTTLKQMQAFISSSKCKKQSHNHTEKQKEINQAESNINSWDQYIVEDH